MPMGEGELVDRLKQLPSYVGVHVVSIGGVRAADVLCEATASGAADESRPAVGAVGEEMRIPLQLHTRSALQVRLRLFARQGGAVLGVASVTLGPAVGLLRVTRKLPMPPAVSLTVAFTVDYPGTAPPAVPPVSAIPEAALISMLKGNAAQALPVAASTGSSPAAAQQGLPLAHAVRREERRLAKANLAAQAVPQLAEWRERLAEASGAVAAVPLTSAGVLAGAAAPVFLQSIVDSGAAAQGGLVSELASILRFPSGREAAPADDFACIAYTRYLTPSVAAAMPGLHLSELLALHFIAQRPEDVDRDVGYRDVPPLPRQGEPAAFTRARELYGKRHTDWSWTQGAPLRNGSLLTAAPEACPMLWQAAAQACRFKAGELWRAEQLVPSQAAESYVVGQTVLWRGLHVAYATQDQALGSAPGGVPLVIFRIARPSRTANLAPLSRCAAGYLLSPLQHYVVRGVSCPPGDVCVVSLECADGDGVLQEKLLASAAAAAKSDSARLWGVVKQLEAKTLRVMSRGTDDESIGESDTSAPEEAVDRALRLAEGHRYSMPEGLLDVLEEVRDALQRERGETRVALQAADERVLECSNREAQHALLRQEQEARAGIAAQVPGGLADLWREHLRFVQDDLSRHLDSSMKELQEVHARQSREEADKLKQRQQHCVRLHVQSMFEKMVGRVERACLRKFWSKLYARATRSARLRSERRLMITVVHKLADTTRACIQQRYFRKLERHVLRRKARASASSLITSISQRALAAKYWARLTGGVAGRQRQREQLQLQRVHHLTQVQAATGIEAQETIERQHFAHNEAVVRAEIDGWKRGFWRREALYMQRQREEDDLQIGAYCRIVDELKEHAAPLDEAWRVQGKPDRASARRLALRITQIAAEELRRLRLLLQDTGQARPTPPSPLPFAKSTVPAPPNPGTPVPSGALSDLRRAMQQAKSHTPDSRRTPVVPLSYAGSPSEAYP